MRKIIIIPCVLICATLTSQRPTTGIWLTVQAPVSINSKWQISNDINYRTPGNSFLTLQYLYRSGVKYIFNKQWSVTGGVAFSFNRTTINKENKEFGKEFRVWQEANYKNLITKKLQYQLRVRTEERSFAATSYTAAYQAFRYRLKLYLQQKIDNRWSFFISNEYMQQHTNSNWAFNQNRLMTNAIFSFTNQTSLQAGYMWILWPAKSSQHIFTISFQQIISLHGKQQ